MFRYPLQGGAKSRTNTLFAIFIAHLLMIICVLTSLLSGLRIHVATTDKSWLSAVQWLLPQGEMYSIHTLSGLTLLATVFFYLAINALLSRWNRLTPLPNLPRLGKRNRSRLMVMTGVLLLLVSLLTGTLLYIEAAIVPFALLLKLHYLSALGFLLFIVLHPLLAWAAGGLPLLLRMFKPRFEYRLLSLALLAFSLSGAGLFYLVFSYSHSQLRIEPIADALIEIDGEAREPEWQQAEAVRVRTVKGQNQAAAGTQVTIKAVSDGEYAYFYFRWRDDTRSLKHLPLIKTAEGWQIEQTGLLEADENLFYEDKFAVMLSRQADIAGAGSTHLGSQPLAHHPKSSGGRGLHYTEDGSLLDVWHWKAVRTGLSLGQADDNYFGKARPSKSEYKRYTGGYQKDRDDCEHLVRWEQGDYHLRPECGGYLMNWQELKAGIVQPRRLPKDASVLQRMGKVVLDPQQSDNGRWWMDWQDTVRYDLEQDDWPIGTVIPSVLSLGPFTQGRGGVEAGASWLKGYWHLEIKRKLESDNPFDLPIESGIYLWVAVFDHSQTRHSYHLHPLRLHLVEAQ